MVRVAVSSLNKDIRGKVDPRLSKCNYFTIVELHNNVITKIEYVNNIIRLYNQYQSYRIIEFLMKHTVDVVISNSINPSELLMLQKQKIKAYQAKETVIQSLEMYSEQKLDEIDKATQQGHHMVDNAIGFAEFNV